MGFLIDTNVISELRKKSRCDKSVQAWQNSIQSEYSYVSVISMMEIRSGIISAKRKSPEFSDVLNEWYELQVKQAFNKRVIPIDLMVSEYCSVLLNQRTRPLADTLIAATAHVHGLTLVTRNLADFSDTGITVVDPWNWGSR